MTLNNDNPVAETTTLRGNKTSPSELVFYAGKQDVWDGCTGAVKLLFSTDSITWSELWTQDLQEWSPQGYEPFRVILPVDESVGKFAVKTLTRNVAGQTATRSTWMISLSPQSSPKILKRKPGPSPAPGASPAPAAKMPAGVGPIPMLPTFQGTCTWAATYCGAAPAPRNSTNTTTVITTARTGGTINITATNSVANGTNTTHGTNTATNTSTDAAALCADNTADDATMTAADEERADTGDQAGATAAGEPADEGDAGDPADTAGNAATSTEELGNSKDATNTATGALPADAAAGSRAC